MDAAEAEQAAFADLEEPDAADLGIDDEVVNDADLFGIAASDLMAAYILTNEDRRSSLERGQRGHLRCPGGKHRKTSRQSGVTEGSPGG